MEQTMQASVSFFRSTPRHHSSSWDKYHKHLEEQQFSWADERKRNLAGKTDCQRLHSKWNSPSITLAHKKKD